MPIVAMLPKRVTWSISAVCLVGITFTATTRRRLAVSAANPNIVCRTRVIGVRCAYRNQLDIGNALILSVLSN